MKFPAGPLPLRQHHLLDLLRGVALAVAPQMLGLQGERAAKYALRSLGLATIGLGLLTEYDYKLSKLIPLEGHMALDTFTGVAAIAAPYALGYHRRLSGAQLAAHLVLGIGALSLVALSRAKTEQQKLDAWADELERRYRLAG